MLVMDTSNHEKINKLYKGVGYFDSYSGSVIGFLFITFCIFLIWSYYAMMQTKEIIKDDWINQRCNPKVIPFAGWINKPDDDSQTAMEFTSENFEFCTQSILGNMMGTMMSPFNALLSQLTTVFTSLNESSNQSRGVMGTLRENIANIAQNVMNRILSVIIPIQTMAMAFTDSLAKTQAVMTTALYTMLGSYYTLQSLMGAILEMIIKMLMALAVVIVGLWIVPFTWPAAAVSTAVFASISVPLSIIALFMTEVLHIHSAGIPKIPSCFDKNTQIQMYNGLFKAITEIKTGDVLIRGETVTATMQLAKGTNDMYWIPQNKKNINNKMDGIIVSGFHPMQQQMSKMWGIKQHFKWIWAKDHPSAILLPNYNESVIYCFNTTNKKIYVGEHVFSDWDELFGDKLTQILNIQISMMEPKSICQTIKTPDNIYKYCDNGLNEDTQILTINRDKLNDKSVNKLESKYIKDVTLGTIIPNGGYVYGIVNVLNVKCVNKPLKHLLTTNHCLTLLQINKETKEYTKKSSICDYNYNIDDLIYLKN